MKTLILWRRKRARTFKQIGIATADGSAATIATMWRAAADGDGTLAIVDAASAVEARRIIDSHARGSHLHTAGVVMESLDGRVLALGARAVMAVAGASEACRNWDARLRRDGRVKVQDTRALGIRSDGAQVETLDAFGEGFKS